MKQQTGPQTGLIDNNKLVDIVKPVNNSPVGGAPDRVKSAANALAQDTLPNSVSSGTNAANELGQVVQTGGNLHTKPLIDMTGGNGSLDNLHVLNADNNVLDKPVANDLKNSGLGNGNAVGVKREASNDNKGDIDGNTANERIHT